MSSTIMYAAPAEGTFQRIAEFRNAWGGAAYVWWAISKKLYGDEAYWLLSAQKEPNAFWQSWKDPRMCDAERFTFCSTFDRVLVRVEEGPRLAAAFREFVRLHPPGHRACHLLAEADLLERIAARTWAFDPPFVPAVIGWQQTTVSENPWWVRPDNEEEDGRPYDLLKDTGHWLLFDELETEAKGGRR